MTDDTTDTTDDMSLALKALANLDAIAEIVEHAKIELDTGELDELEGSLDAIETRANALLEDDDE